MGEKPAVKRLRNSEAAMYRDGILEIVFHVASELRPKQVTFRGTIMFK